MKKLFRSLLLTLLLVGILSACAANLGTPQTESETSSSAAVSQGMQTNETQSTPEQESASDASSSQEDSADIPLYGDEAEIDPVDRQIFDPYWQLSNTDPFLFAMRDNPIDAQAVKIMEDRYTTGDMREGVYMICDLWEAEMEASLQQLLDAIQNTDLQQQLLESQAAWKAYVDASQIVDDKLMTRDGEDWGTIMLVTIPAARMEKYRARTILLKYLLYLYAGEYGVIPQFLPIEP